MLPSVHVRGRMACGGGDDGGVGVGDGDGGVQDLITLLHYVRSHLLANASKHKIQLHL